MAMDSLHGDHGEDTLVVLARDGHGAIRGVLHFVPCYGRPAVSLSFMRRDPRTPNGLTEFLVVRPSSCCATAGVDEMSLNFVAFARWMHSPERPVERVLGKLVAPAIRSFRSRACTASTPSSSRVGSPAISVYQGAFGLPRASVAAMWAEGQLPKPELPRAASSPGARLMARAR